jgi:hypothetical protein
LEKSLLISTQFFPDHATIQLPIPPKSVNEVGHPQDVPIDKPLPVSKVAGSRRRPLSRKDGNSKSQALSDSESDDVMKWGRGRPSGAGNFADKDVKVLLDFVERVLPCGARGWRKVHQKFSQWSCRNRRPERTVKSIEMKYKQVCNYFD